MDGDNQESLRTPRWVLALVIVMLLPLYPVLEKAFAAAKESDNAEMMMLGKYLPGFAVIAAVCVYYAYSRNRTAAWIVLAMWALTYIALYWWGCAITG